MPQLDKVTYVSQLFWLFLFFVSFYLISVNYVLPSIGQILKVRKRRMEDATDGTGNLHGEESTVTDRYEGILEESLVHSREFIGKSMKDSFVWLDESVKAANDKTFSTVNKNYIKAISDISAKKHVINNIIDSK